MHNLRLTGGPFAKPADVVRWLGAVQSQDYGPAKWSVGARVRSGTDAGLDALYDRGAILRTHVLRPTWHFVLPEDIRWMLDLTGPRVRRMISYYDAQLGIDARLTKRTIDRMVKALEREGRMTRTELADELERSKIEARGQRLNHIVMNAELAGAICSGGLRGKQHTYALLDERTPKARRLDRDDALAELTLRYFTSHGPATIKDFSWWASLPVADSRRGLEMVGDELETQEVEGRTFWFAPGGRVPAVRSLKAYLLQAYDECIVGYTDSRFLLDTAGAVPKQTPTERIIYPGALVIGTQVAGHWKRTLGPDKVRIDVAVYKRLNSAQTKALEQEAERLGRFLGLEPSVATTLIPSPQR
jgi:hypothetical protein